MCDTMKKITSLKIDWYDNGLTCADSIVHQSISVYRNRKQIAYKGFNGLNKDMQEYEVFPMQSELCEQLFILLEHAETNNEFKEDFRVVVCDGSAWEMRLRHSDNTTSLIEGTVEFPTHGEKIEHYIRTAIDQTFSLVNPMIFGCSVYDDENDE